MERHFFCFLIIWFFCCHSFAATLREKLSNSPCTFEQFRCKNDDCIDKHLYCNDVNNCGDNSDEEYCRNSYGRCPDSFFRCNEYACLPPVWKCDGTIDCQRYRQYSHSSYNNDEENCESEESLFALVNSARRQVLNWLDNIPQNHTTSTGKWGPHLEKIAVAQFWANPDFVSRKEELAYELSIQLLSKFTLKKMKEVSTTEFSPYVNALLVTCIDPRKFHSLDLVKELRSRVNGQNYSNPFDLLTLCNAGEKMTKKDIEKLKNAVNNPQREIWTDTQAIALLALVCAGQQPGSSFSLDSLAPMTDVLKQKQYRNGTVENVKTTALVLQVLFASQTKEDENTFDEEKAFRQILQEQREDGSFGTIEDTYFILPVLHYKSMVNISTDHCAPYFKDEETALIDLLNRPGPKIRIRFSLWIGNEKDVERTLKLRVPVNSTFYEIMEIAGDIDSRFRFQYVMKHTKPYITAVSGITDDPETGRFWFPYIFNETKPYPLIQSPADVVLKENDHVAMWYQTGSWIE